MVADRRAVKVIHGANDGEFEVAGYPLARLCASLVDAFNIPADAIALANGRRVSVGYIAQAEDVIEFVRERGEKGGRKTAAAATPADGDGDEQPAPDSPATSRDGLLDAEEPPTTPPQRTDSQILQNAKTDVHGDTPSSDPLPHGPAEAVGDPVERRVAEIMEQLAAGLRADADMESDRLTLARNGGSLVLELKSIVPFGKYMDKLKERFPRSSYHKLHRWRLLAERDHEVEAALQAHPNVSWGPTKMIDYLKGKWSPEAEAEQGEDVDTGDLEGGPLESTDQLPADEDATEPSQVDEATDSGSEQQTEEKPQDGTNVPDKRYEKLMGRFKKGGDMHKGGKTKAKTAQPPGYRLTVVTPEKGDLDKFGALLPNPITDLNAHSVTAWVRLQDIASTLTSVGSALTASSLKKVRVVVEL